MKTIISTIKYNHVTNLLKNLLHCIKIARIRSFFWSEYGKIRTRKNSVFGYFLRSVIFHKTIFCIEMQLSCKGTFVIKKNRLFQPAITCSKLTIETLRCSGVFIVNFEHISHLAPLLILSR